MTRTGTKRRRETKKGVEVLVQWKDSITIWVTLKDMKNSYPVQMDEYAVHRHNPVQMENYAAYCRIAGDPAFVWWTRNVLAKRNHIIG